MKRIGIIAGAGSLPLEVAESVVAHGGAVHIIMVQGADAVLEAFPHTAVNWAQLGRATAALKGDGIHDILFLGGGARPSFRNARPDFAFFRELPRVLRLLKAGGDDAVLRGLLGVFERQGFTVVGVGDVARELLVPEGSLTKASPSSDDAGDIARGFDLVAALGRFDIGQAVVISRGQIEALEGAEGTDRMLKRVAEARAARGVTGRSGVLVKRPKPGQDLRVDLPAIGPNTVANASAAGLAGIAVMAGHVLSAQRADMIAAADEQGLFVVGIREGRTTREAAADGQSLQIRPAGSVAIDAPTRKDVTRAAGIIASLASFGGCPAVVIDRGRVLAVGTSDDAMTVISRAGRLRGSNAKRRGVVVLGSTEVLSKAVIEAANAARLSGAVATAPPGEISPAVIAAANEFAMFAASAQTPVSKQDEPRTMATATAPKPLKIFLVAGEHSGDALGAKLIGALKSRYQAPISFA
ncbi:MAG: UDP-2,3-diacylglucosamine diphosphatase LpxI, partial [Hyphomicrobium sp.]